MYNVFLFDDWDRLDGGWQAKTKKEAEELKAYVESKIKDLNLESKFSSCIICEIEEGTKEIVDEFFEDVLEYIREEAEEQEENNKNYVSPLNGAIDKFDTTNVPNIHGMFKECK